MIGKNEESIKCFRQAVELGRDPGALVNLAFALQVKGNNIEAIECLEEAVHLDSLDPQLPIAY
jgi:tetratricopeptide (TPR) repeat protein